METQTLFLCSDLVSVEWHESPGQLSTAPAILDDISAHNARLRLENPIPVETNVRLLCGWSEFDGRVSGCHVSRAAAGHEVSIRFAEGHQWSIEKYRPKHVIDPRSLSDPTACRAVPSCAGGRPCPHRKAVNAAASPERSAESTRRVAREVAGVCHNLDVETLTICYQNLYGESRADMLREFVDTYQETVSAFARSAAAAT